MFIKKSKIQYGLNTFDKVFYQIGSLNVVKNQSWILLLTTLILLHFLPQWHPIHFFNFTEARENENWFGAHQQLSSFFSSHASQSITPRPENFFVANIDQKLMDCLPATSSVAFSADLALPTLSNISGFTQKICPLNWYWMIPQLLFFATEKRKYATQKEKEKIKEQPLLRIRIGFKIRFPLEYFSLHVSWQVIKIWPSLENISIFEKNQSKFITCYFKRGILGSGTSNFVGSLTPIIASIVLFLVLNDSQEKQRSRWQNHSVRFRVRRGCWYFDAIFKPFDFRFRYSFSFAI